jgi:hypothetical protein
LRRASRSLAAACAAAAALSVAGCRQDMHDQPKVEPLERSSFFPDNRAARPLPANTVARGQLALDEHLATGKLRGEFADTFPVEVTRALLERGRERYDIYCSPCHDRTGSGRGMIVERGYPRPRSFHEERLREAPPGYFFSAATNGFGVMPSYATQVPVLDRWAIVAYVRALQLSQHASLEELEPPIRRLLEAQAPGAASVVPSPAGAVPSGAPAHGAAGGAVREGGADDGHGGGRDTAPGDVRGGDASPTAPAPPSGAAREEGR